jgi:hypothetical protein
MNVQLAFLNPQPDGARALIGKLRHALNGLTQLLAIQRDKVRMILGKHALEIGKVPCQFAAQQQPLAKLKKQMVVVARK